MHDLYTTSWSLWNLSNFSKVTMWLYHIELKFLKLSWTMNSYTSKFCNAVKLCRKINFIKNEKKKSRLFMLDLFCRFYSPDHFLWNYQSFSAPRAIFKEILNFQTYNHHHTNNHFISHQFLLVFYLHNPCEKQITKARWYKTLCSYAKKEGSFLRKLSLRKLSHEWE